MRIKATRLLDLSCVSQVLEQLSCSTESVNAMMVSQTTINEKKRKKEGFIIVTETKDLLHISKFLSNSKFRY